MALTNAQLSADIAALIESYQDWQNLYSDWLGGTATGGPNGDGRYPLKDAQGVVSLVYCPAALESNVVGPSQKAEAEAAAAEMHRMASQAAATLANSHKTFALAARDASQDARDLSQILRDQTAGMHSNVVYYAGLISANATTTSADRIAVAALAANTANAASNAASSASSAAASANAAATFNPALFDLKSDGIASSRLTGIIDIDRIPVLPSQKTYTSSGGIADLTGPQQALIGEGTIITTTDGRRWVYTSGSKTSEASYTILADVTPSWSAITDKPSTFAASPHGHVWADLIDKPDLVINGQASMTARGATGNGYTVIAGGNADYTGSIGFHQGDGTRLGYIGGAHSSNKFIPFVAENGGAYYFNTRPLFGGMVPWDAANLSPVTTNTDQTIFSRKIFKDLTSGTAATATYSVKPLEVQSLSASDDALMSFHIPGIRAAMFGLATGGDWVVGATTGPAKLWHERNFDPNTKLTCAYNVDWRATGSTNIVGGAGNGAAQVGGASFGIHVGNDTGLYGTAFAGRQNRYYGRTLENGSYGSWHEFWHSGNFDPSTKFNVSGGNISGNVALQKATPILYFNDTGASGALGRFRFYSAANNFYFTRNTDASGGWGVEQTIFRASSVNGTVTMEAPVSFSTTATFNSDVTFNGGSIVNSNWWRSTGQTGWYNSTYGTGIYSIAAGSVRTYNNASFTAEGSLNTLTANIYQNNGANRVPVTTVSQSAPSGGVDGDVHIVW